VTEDTTPTLVASTNTAHLVIGNEIVNKNRCFDGYMGEFAMWTGIQLNSDEVALLADRYSPLFVHPENLYLYSPMVRNVQDVIGAASVTLTGTTVISHPPIIYPAMPYIITAPAVVALAPTGALYGSLVGPMGGPI